MNNSLKHKKKKSKPILVCRHLAEGTKQGFFTINDKKSFPDAWCAECELIFQLEEGWTEESLAFADFDVICPCCYPKAKERALNMH